MSYIGAILRGFRSLLTGLGITGREIGSKSVTLRYPHEEPELSDAFRSVIQLVRFDETGSHDCIACMQCEKICPSFCIKIEGGRVEGIKGKRASSFELDFALCSLCGLCIDTCPTDTLEYAKFYDEAGRERHWIYDLIEPHHAFEEQYLATRREIEAKEAAEKEAKKAAAAKAKAEKEVRDAASGEAGSTPEGGIMIAAGVVMLISVAGAVLAVTVRNMVHAIFGLGVALGGVALAFLSLGSPFLAAMEVLIYIGGITIAMIFAVMLSPMGKQEPREGGRRRVLAGVVSILLFIAMASVIVGADFTAAPDRTLAESEAGWSVQAIGRALIDDFNVAFELLSVVLLVAIVGAITIAARRDETQDPAIDEQGDA